MRYRKPPVTYAELGEPGSARTMAQVSHTAIPMMFESYGTKWDKHGKAYSQRNGGRWTRDPGRDFGTPTGDLIIDQWLQDTLKKPPKWRE